MRIEIPFSDLTDMKIGDNVLLKDYNNAANSIEGKVVLVDKVFGNLILETNDKKRFQIKLTVEATEL